MACAVMATSSMVGMGASAATVSKTEKRSSDFLTYSNSYFGDFSKLNAQSYAGTISSTNSNYNGSWKNISYYTYTEDGGRYYIQGNGGDSGTSASVSCSNTQVNSATAKREYVASMKKTSSSTSSSVDLYTILFNK